MNSREHQEIYQALVVASNKVASALTETAKLWSEVHQAFEKELNPFYHQVEDLNNLKKAQAATEFNQTSGHQHNIALTEVAQNLNHQTNKLAKRNNEIQSITIQLEFLGNKTLPHEIAQKIYQGQEQLIDMSNQVNEVAIKAQQLFKKQALVSGNPTASPEQKEKLNDILGQLTQLNKTYKEEVKKQSGLVADVKSDVEQGITPTIKPSGPRR